MDRIREFPHLSDVSVISKQNTMDITNMMISSMFQGLDGGTEVQETNRSSASNTRLYMRQKGVYIPRRCEIEGCTVVNSDSLSRCGQCKCVFYCSPDHQREDWDRHKKECKHLARVQLEPIPFSTVEELEKFPIDCFPLEDVDLEASSCFVCGATSNEVNLGYTDCCNAVVCDNEHEYKMCSYSRDHCKRSHSRYTTCGSHKNEGHSGDWRQCQQCDERLNDEPGVRSWYNTNAFNVTPALETSFPKGSTLTKQCCHQSEEDGSRCKKRILPGHDGELTSFRQDQAGGSECMAHGAPY